MRRVGGKGNANGKGMHHQQSLGEREWSRKGPGYGTHWVWHSALPKQAREGPTAATAATRHHHHRSSKAEKEERGQESNRA